MNLKRVRRLNENLKFLMNEDDITDKQLKLIKAIIDYKMPNFKTEIIDDILEVNNEPFVLYHLEVEDGNIIINLTPDYELPQVFGEIRLPINTIDSLGAEAFIDNLKRAFDSVTNKAKEAVKNFILENGYPESHEVSSLFLDFASEIHS